MSYMTSYVFSLSWMVLKKLTNQSRWVIFPKIYEHQKKPKFLFCDTNAKKNNFIDVEDIGIIIGSLWMVLKEYWPKKGLVIFSKSYWVSLMKKLKNSKFMFCFSKYFFFKKWCESRRNYEYSSLGHYIWLQK